MTQILQKQSTPVRQFRLVFLLMILAFVIIEGVVFLLAFPGSVFRLNKWELSIITDTITILVVLCPLVVCMAPFYFLMVASIYGMYKTHNSLSRRLRRTQGLAAGVADRTAVTMDSLGRHSIKLNTHFTFLNRFFSELDQSEGNINHERNPEAG